MSVNSLSQLEAIEAIHIMVRNINFAKVNEHLSMTEILGLKTKIIIWPNCPVFSPYAVTHNGYSQVRYQGKKYLVHRIAYRSYVDIPIPDEMDISHTVYLGDNTS